MANEDIYDEDDVLANLLQQEGEQTRPVFSESLHARICRAVEQSESVEAPRPAARSRLVRVGLLAAAAATLAIGAFYLIRYDTTPQTAVRPDSTDQRTFGPEPDEDPQTLADEPVNAAVDIGLLVDSTLTKQQWAYLDHDAQLAASMLLDQLPGSITRPEETP